jgi:hypothetical protein
MAPDDDGDGDAPRPAASGPWWVVLVASLYVLLAAVVTLGPVVVGGLMAADEPNRAVVYLLLASAYFLVVFACGASLLVIPIRARWPRPHRKTRIWIPLVGSAVLAGVVFAGFGVAALELAVGGHSEFDTFAPAVLAGIPLVWVVWAGVFWSVSRSTDPLTLNGRLYKTLLAGSVLEFLVAVPMHLIVRQRDECCAGVYTTVGIAVGLIVAVIALGPAVFLLFYRRHTQTSRKR